VGLLAAILVMLILEGLFFSFLVDDSFISYRYAVNLTQGEGLVFNPGERVEGYSNFLWVVFLAGLKAIGVPIVMASKCLGVLLSVGSVTFAFLLSRKLSDAKGILVLASVFLSATDIGFVRWSVAGMETQLAVFLFLAAVFFFAREMQTRSRLQLSAILLGLLSVTRPEAPVLFVAALAFRVWQRKKSWSSADTIWIASYALVVLPFLAFRYSYYGSLMPNSYYAKTGGGVKRIAAGIRYANQFFASNGGYVLVPLLSVPFIFGRRKLVLVYVFLVAYLFFIVYVGGDHMDDFRFFVPILPLVFLLAQEGMIELSRLLKRWGRPFLVLALLGLALSNIVQDYYGAAVLWWGDAKDQIRLLKDGTFHPERVYDRARVGLWLKENADPDMVVAVEDCGMIPYYSDLVTIDMFGLMDTHLARLKGMMHHKFDASYVLQRRPDLVILIRYPEWLGGEPFWQSEVDRQLAANETFRREYRIRHRIEGEKRWFLIYERGS
jgi:hypothetical protein